MILKYVIVYDDGTNSRFYCKFWCEIINHNSTSEAYHLPIESPTSLNNMVNERKFEKLVPEFLSYDRKNISFVFHEINFENTKDYWIQKGEHIRRLHFCCCEAIPIVDILKHCNRMKNLNIYINHSNVAHNLEQSMKQCLREGISNLSLTQIHLFIFGHVKYDKEKMFNLVRLVNGVLPHLKTLELGAVSLYDDSEPNVLDSISQAFKYYNVNIILKNWFTEDDLISEVSFNSSPDVPPISLLAWAHHSYDEEEKLDFTTNYYYRDMHTLRYACESTVSFLMFEEVMSNSCLKELSVAATHINYIGTRSFKNQLKELQLFLTLRSRELTTDIEIGGKFVESFQKLESLRITTLSFLNFANVINRFKTLTDLQIFSVITKEIEVFSNATLSSESLTHLYIPRSYFIQTTYVCEYYLPNLEELYLTNGGSIPFEKQYDKWNRNIDHNDLKRVNCPKLHHLKISLVERLDHLDHQEYIKWFKNILNLFPNIVQLFFDEDGSETGSLTISDDELTDLLISNPFLCSIGGFKDISNRIDELISRLKKSFKSK